MTDAPSRWRAWLAAGLSLLLPGLGHAYLRRFARMLAWLAVMFAVATLLVVVVVLPAQQLPTRLSLEAILEFQRTLPTSVQAAMWLVRGLVAVDAFVIARQATHDRAVENGRQCPECGKELDDPDLSFCPWCATELEPATPSTEHNEA